MLQSTHDGHFVYVPDSVGAIFNFARPVPLVSVSEDGKALPKPFVYADVLAESFKNVSFTPSAITKINGEDALVYLENWAQYGSLQDRDALYNNVFYQLASVSLGPTGSGIGTFAGSGRGRWVCLKALRSERSVDSFNRFIPEQRPRSNSRTAQLLHTATMRRFSFPSRE